MDVTVAVATYGDDSWRQLALERAVPSAQRLDVPTISVHHFDGTLHEARNDCLDRIHTEWVCFLDADDELEPGYFDHMALGTADLRAPAVRYVTDGRAGSARIPRVAGHHHDCVSGCLRQGNWLVIGTVAPTEIVREVGGFRDFAWSEDWDLWLRCYLTGATVQPIRRAVYRAHVRRDSRNRAPSREARIEAHHAIAAANGLPV